MASICDFFSVLSGSMDGLTRVVFPLFSPDYEAAFYALAPEGLSSRFLYSRDSRSKTELYWEARPRLSARGPLALRFRISRLLSMFFRRFSWSGSCSTLTMFEPSVVPSVMARSLASLPFIFAFYMASCCRVFTLHARACSSFRV